MPVEIFCCYSRKDLPLLNELKAHLIPLQRMGLVTIWADMDINAGKEWEKEIQRHLDTSQIILLLVSPDFMSSDYAYSKEMMRAMERHERGEARVIPIILRPVLWERSPIGKLQALPTEAKPVISTSWYTLDDAFLNVAEGIRRAVEHMRTTSFSRFNEHPEVPSHTSSSLLSMKPRQENELVSAKNVPAQLMSSFYRKHICPFCFHRFKIGECEVVSGINSGKILHSAPKTVLQRLSANMNPPSLTGSKYTLELAYRICPKCKNPLQYNIEHVDNISIAIIGDTYSGKSHYIFSLVHEMYRWTRQANQYTRMTCLTPGKYTEENIAHLFQEKIVLPGTQPMAVNPSGELIMNPIIYEFVPPSLPAKKINLITYDVAGEDYMSPERLLWFHRHLLDASAIIFLVDPLQVPGIMEKLKFPTQKQHVGYSRQRTILDTVIHLFERYHNLNGNLQVPIAITLSKSDMLKYMTPMSTSNDLDLLMHNPTYRATIDWEEIAAVDKEVRKLFIDCEEYTILQASQRFTQAAFFAIAATGNEADENGSYPNIEPCRCLDPLLWVLHRLQVL